MNTQEEDSHLQAKEKGLEEIFPSQPSGGTNPADTFILDFQPLNLWDLVTAASAN